MKIKLKIKRQKNGSPENVKNLEELSIKAYGVSMGIVEQIGKAYVKNLQDLAIYYTPGVAHVSNAIRADKSLSYKYTSRGNKIAIISDGSRILGLGDIGPEAGLPVMEGKALLFKQFGNVDALPITINAETADQIIEFAKAIEPSIAGINMEDIAAPKCFEVFDRLTKELNIPVFHDDRQGTAVVVCAALKNALKVVEKDMKTAKIVINGIGASGIGIAQLLLAYGASNIIMCDTRGILYKGRNDNTNQMKETLAEHTNKQQLKGQLPDATKNADVLIGVSTRGAFNDLLIKSMAPKAIVFALANPDPEIAYDKAKLAGATIVATGQSAVPNQVNNLLAFPAIFRGMLEVQARKINTAMLQAASDELADSMPKSKLYEDHIIPNFMEEDITEITANIAAAVAKAAMDTGVSNLKADPSEIKKKVRLSLKRYSKLQKRIAKLNKKMPYQLLK